MNAPGANARQGRWWGRRFRAREWFDRTWLVIPSLYVVAAVMLGTVVPDLEGGRHVDPLGLELSNDSARQVLNAVAGGMIAFTGLVVSVAVVVVQFGAGQYTPRLVLRFRRDLAVKHALGIFIAPALYALTALGKIGPSGRLAPDATVGLAVMLLIAAVLAFFWLVARLLDLLRPRRLFELLLAGCEQAIDQVYPRPYGRDEDGPVTDWDQRPITATVRHEGPQGVVSALDRFRLLEAAESADAYLEVECVIGGFIWRGGPMVHVRGPAGAVSTRELERAVIVSDERTLTQDPAFAIRTIVDIAIRSLSPAVNDPTTASQALDTVESLLHGLASRRLGDAHLHGSDGRLRVVYRAAGWADLLTLALTEIRSYGVGSHQVARRMRALLEGLQGTVPPARAAAVREQLELLDAAVARAHPDPAERALATTADHMGLGGHS